MARREVENVVAKFSHLLLLALRREDWGEIAKIKEALAEALEGLGLSIKEIREIL